MHPSLSVIFFTTASGAGYGLLALLGVLAPFGMLPADPLFGLAALALALGAITAGLLFQDADDKRSSKTAGISDGEVQTDAAGGARSAQEEAW